MKQQAALIDTLHFLKLIIDMRNDQDNAKWSHWNINYLFGTFLFNKYIDIMGHIEMIYVAFVTICRCVCEEPDAEGKKSHEEYKLHMLTCFESLVDFYEVMFRNIHANMLGYVASTKKVSAETKKNYLRTLKIGNFFEYSGNKHVVSVGLRKRKDGDINFKFLKMLLSRSSEFHKFVKAFEKVNDPACMDAFEFQCLQMLNRLLVEEELRQEEEKQREAQEIADQEALINGTTGEASEGMDDPVRKASAHSGGPGGDLLLQRHESKKRVFGYQNRAREAQHGEIMFDEDDEDEAVSRPHHATGANRNQRMDEKTRKYLEKIKNYQDEDEYDDTHDMGDRRPNRNRFRKEEEHVSSNDSEEDEDGRVNHRKKNRNNQVQSKDTRGGQQNYGRNNNQVQEKQYFKKQAKDNLESDDPDVEDSSGEDADVISNWERKHSRLGEQAGDADTDGSRPNTAIRGGFRGGRGGRGGDDRKRDMKREKHNAAKYQPHERSRKDAPAFYPKNVSQPASEGQGEGESRNKDSWARGGRTDEPRQRQETNGADQYVSRSNNDGDSEYVARQKNPERGRGGQRQGGRGKLQQGFRDSRYDKITIGSKTTKKKRNSSKRNATEMRLLEIETHPRKMTANLLPKEAAGEAEVGENTNC